MLTRIRAPMSHPNCTNYSCAFVQLMLLPGCRYVRSFCTRSSQCCSGRCVPFGTNTDYHTCECLFFWLLAQPTARQPFLDLLRGLLYSTHNHNIQPTYTTVALLAANTTCVCLCASLSVWQAVDVALGFSAMCAPVIQTAAVPAVQTAVVSSH